MDYTLLKGLGGPVSPAAAKQIMKHINAVTLWLGMYAITCCLFWYETGLLSSGLRMGLVSATLKTLWSLAHKKLTHSPANLEESVRI